MFRRCVRRCVRCIYGVYTYITGVLEYIGVYAAIKVSKGCIQGVYRVYNTCMTDLGEEEAHV